MGEALLWGIGSAGTLLLGAVIAFVRPPKETVLGVIMGFGAGVLLSAVAYELVAKAIQTAGGPMWTSMGMFAGALVFVGGDVAVGRFGYRNRKDISGAAPEGGGLTIVLGTLLDGVPESAVLGLTVLQTGEVGVAMVIAVCISNLPEGIAATSGLLNGGWTRRRIVGLWSLVMVAAGLSAGLGFLLLDSASDGTLAFILGFAGGAILTMLATSMVPEAYEHVGRPAGLANVFGFAVAVFVSWFDI